MADVQISDPHFLLWSVVHLLLARVVYQGCLIATPGLVYYLYTGQEQRTLHNTVTLTSINSHTK